MIRARLCFVVESGTDVRLVDELARRFDLTVLARRIPRGLPISQTPDQALELEVGPTSRTGFARLVLRRLISGQRFDAVLVQGYALAALAANLAARLGRAKTFMLVCSPVELYYRCRAKNRVSDKEFRRWELFGLSGLARVNARLARHYIVLSQHLAEVVRSHGTNAQIDVIPVYGVDLDIFHPTTEPPAAIRERLGLPMGGKIIFFSSRVAPEKDSKTLLLALKALLRDGRQLWLLHRSGQYRRFLQEAERFGVAERVIATDARHPLKGLALDYQASDLCVQASREEGLGFSPLEALACGVPVVAAAVGGLRETIVDGETGWTYPVADEIGLARSIVAAFDHPAEARRRTETGRKLVAERFERRRVFDRLETLLLGET
jgi:glycosyltransferase involved in cell wall biosynthesis